MFFSGFGGRPKRQIRKKTRVLQMDFSEMTASDRQGRVPWVSAARGFSGIDGGGAAGGLRWLVGGGFSGCGILQGRCHF